MLLLVGACQLLYSPHPRHALPPYRERGQARSRGLGGAWASKLVNGVLRRLQRERGEALEQRVDACHDFALPSPIGCTGPSSPRGPAQAGRILTALQGRPPMVLRVALNKIGMADYLARLTAQGLECAGAPTVPSALVLDSAVAVDRLPVRAGLVSVQDAGARSWPRACPRPAAGAARPRCPCGARRKDLDILQHVGGLQVTAGRGRQRRLQRVAQNLRRGGVHTDLHAGDAAQPQLRGLGSGAL